MKKISIQQVVDIVFDDLQAQSKDLGLRIYKRRLPKGVREGCVVMATDITFEDNQLAMVYALATIPDVKSGGSYEENPKTSVVAAWFADHYARRFPHGESWSLEMQGQSVEDGEDGQSHVVSNRFLFTINTD